MTDAAPPEWSASSCVMTSASRCAKTFPAQERHDDAAAGVGVGPVDRTGVVQHGVAARSHEHGEALPHVEERDPGSAGIGSRRP